MIFCLDYFESSEKSRYLSAGRTGSLFTLIWILSSARFFKLLPIDGKRNKYQTWLYNEGPNVLQLHQIAISQAGEYFTIQS